MQEEGLRVHAKLWLSKIDALRKYVQALHPDSQDMDWLFCSNNPLSPEFATISLPVDFKVPKEDPQAHLMYYNDYMNLLGASDAAKCKKFGHLANSTYEAQCKKIKLEEQMCFS
ncbi:hypothetical protein J1N35_033823 [Gossypium stocksii]|uniref:Uncharacterized protein n=1 Tax=Gossypium stocksii TaxID=47602 RepID=A0A9D3UQT7_9ROSI|nr:hypothetical protein J1N35_033823 [Gossypium stocksii]